MFGLDRPNLNWTSIAIGMGVEGELVESSEDLASAFQRGLEKQGPYLIEAVI